MLDHLLNTVKNNNHVTIFLLITCCW